MVKHRSTAIFEIFILVTAIVAFAYMVGEADKKELVSNGDSGLVILFRALRGLIFNDRGIVSAADSSNLEKGAYTCIKSKDGKICQEYLASDCESKCNPGECIPSSRDNVAECRLGTCYDEREGTCQVMAPKKQCEDFGGKWFDDKNGNIAECKKGCCIIKDEASFLSPQQCTKSMGSLGIQGEFRPEVSVELDCLLLSKTQEEGACTTPSEEPGKNDCGRTTRSECLQKGGEFYSNFLCSSPGLNTTCEKQKTVGCADGKDEVYWFDSCGNRENIYSADKIKSLNGYKILAKNESCAIGNSVNWILNKATCGNCDYLLGSKCGLKSADESLADSSLDYVCKDLSCKDESGNRRENGESWCDYEGHIGLDSKNSNNPLRSTDTVGSRQFRKVCIDGEVKTEPCADYRNEICVEAQQDIGLGKKISNSACRVNRWQQCLSYNNEESGQSAGKKIDEQEKADKCAKNSDCFLKKIDVDKFFKFSVCLPKYAPGFDLGQNGDGANSICGVANQQCKVIYVKDISGWKCAENCNCETAEFTQQMNDFCMSLGDCGAKANYIGDLTENYKIKKAPKLGNSYLNILKSYASDVPGQMADVGNLSEFAGMLGLQSSLNPSLPSQGNQWIGFIGPVAGMAGIWVSTLAKTSAATAGTAASAFAPMTISTGTVTYSTAGETLVTSAGSSIASMANMASMSLSAVAVAASLYSLYQTFNSKGPVLLGNVILGVVGLGVSTVAMLASFKVITVVAFTGMFGIFIALGVVALMLIMKFAFGVGDTKEVIVDFKCEPWEAPLGGAKCAECGKNGLPCSRYSCGALGQTCEFINEGTDNELCVDNNPNDVNPPVIGPLESVLNPGYRYDVTGNGFTVSGPDGCVKAYDKVSFGVKTDEPSQCRLSVEHAQFEEMDDFGNDLFSYNHSTEFLIPSPESLGVQGYDPNRQADMTLYVRCRDKNGNTNVNEYAIKMCVKPGEDRTAPIVTGRDPNINGLKFGATQQNMSVFTNEPAECRWDMTDMDYDVMANSFSCNNGFSDQELLGWRCRTTLFTGQNETTFYVRCKDQPWLGGVNESMRNKDGESYLINLKRSESELRIDSIEPSNGTIKVGTAVASVNFVVKTSGGYDGSARCAYSFDQKVYIDFADTFGTTHKQLFESFTAGRKVVYVRCEDVVGNSAEGVADFSIEQDTSAPTVTRVYSKSGSLIIITNENAQCAYKTMAPDGGDGCSFDFTNGTLMGGSELVHSSNLESGKTHYVRCKDGYGNLDSGCSIVVRGTQ